MKLTTLLAGASATLALSGQVKTDNTRTLIYTIDSATGQVGATIIVNRYVGIEEAQCLGIDYIMTECQQRVLSKRGCPYSREDISDAKLVCEALGE
jgi:hypothetical protein